MRTLSIAYREFYVMSSSIEVWLWLLLVMQPNNPKTNKILSICSGDAVKASRAIRDKKFPFLSENENNRALETRNGNIMHILKICNENNIQILTLDSDEYPALLKEIENPPIVLFVKGDISALNSKLMISAVGTKRPSEYSLNVTENIVGTLSKVGAVMVSGNAEGLDTAVHRACIKAKGRSVAVLPCGILANYPRGDKDLKNDIIKSGGAVVSELLPYTSANLYYFRPRDRIISGLSLGTLVLQAGEKSGALVTANLAFSQNREVFYIPPHNIFSKEYGGTRILAYHNAVPVFDASDITESLLKNTIEKEAVFNKIKNIKHENSEPIKSKPQEPPKPQNIIKKEKPDIPENLSDDERKLVEIIAEKETDIETLISKSGLSYENAISALTMLELAGVLERQMDGNYAFRG